MKKAIFLTLAASALIGAHSSAIAADKASQTFLTKAIEGNLAEVQMGELAQKNGQSAEVKSYGQMLQTDHSAANQKAMEAAKALGVNAPAEPNAKQKSEYDRMSKMSGPAFDKAFAQHMIADHKKDISEYQAEAKKQDAAGKYAMDSLPTLQKHLEKAQSLQKPGATTGSR